jgi:acid phosphatase class B
MEQSWMAFSIQDCFLFQSAVMLAGKKPTNPRNGDRKEDPLVWECWGWNVEDMGSF